MPQTKNEMEAGENRAMQRLAEAAAKIEELEKLADDAMVIDDVFLRAASLWRRKRTTPTLAA